MQKVDFWVRDKSQETVRAKLESIFGEDCDICFEGKRGIGKIAHVTQQHYFCGERKYLVIYLFGRKRSADSPFVQFYPKQYGYDLYIGYERE